MSIVRDPETYEKFEQVILVHGVRQKDELAYHELLHHTCRSTSSWATWCASKLLYYPTVTREPTSTWAASPT